MDSGHVLLKDIDMRDRYLVEGYLRDQHKELFCSDYNKPYFNLQHLAYVILIYSSRIIMLNFDFNDKLIQKKVDLNSTILELKNQLKKQTSFPVEYLTFRGERLEDAIPIAFYDVHNFSTIATSTSNSGHLIKGLKHLQTLYDQELISQEDFETRKSEIEVAMERLKHLHTLYDHQIISQEDFEIRKSQIVDEVTGTSEISNSINSQQISGCRRRAIPFTRRDPDWSNIRSEQADKWTYDSVQEKWLVETCTIKIDAMPFDRGGVRYVFHLKDLSQPNKKYVAKMSLDMRDNIRKEMYFNDVLIRTVARYFCHGINGYNSHSPPKKVDFLEAHVFHLTQRENSPVCHVERYVEGTYRKYNCFGWSFTERYVEGNIDEDEINTVQAFAHFTYEASKRKLIVCDIMAVNDSTDRIYTDPQVHSIENGKAFGRGNLGIRGIDKFLRTHRCNPICRYLTLPIMFNANSEPINFDFAKWTVPFDFEKLENVPLLSDKEFPNIHCVVDENDMDIGESSSCWSKICVIL